MCRKFVLWNFGRWNDVVLQVKTGERNWDDILRGLGRQ